MTKITRPDINGWELTNNEYGVEMATIPAKTMRLVSEYSRYAEKQIEQLEKELEDNKAWSVNRIDQIEKEKDERKKYCKILEGAITINEDRIEQLEEEKENKCTHSKLEKWGNGIMCTSCGKAF